jgi:hypothetical protein
MLIVLDDAANPGQVQPLLPGDPGCAVIITTRHWLAGLPGVRLEIGALDEPSGVHLLSSVIGAHRVSAEPEAARALVRTAALSRTLDCLLSLAAEAHRREYGGDFSRLHEDAGQADAAVQAWTAALRLAADTDTALADRLVSALADRLPVPCSVAALTGTSGGSTALSAPEYGSAG